MKYFSNKVLDEKIKKGGGGGGGTYTADEETLHLDENNEFSIDSDWQNKINQGAEAYSKIYFQPNTYLPSLIELKSSFDYLGARDGIVFGGLPTFSVLQNWEPDLYVKYVGEGANRQRVLYSPLALITAGDQIVGDGTPGGGDVPVHYLNDLTDVVITSPSNGQALVYQNGNWVNGSAIPDLSNYYTKSETDTQISSAITALNLGTASTYDVATTISSGSDNSHLATAKSVYDYVSLAITSALKYRGITTTDIKTNPTQNPIIINGNPYTAVAGDVVLMDGSSKEYLWNGSSWQELGDETSYVLKTQTINGYALSGDITLGISDIIGGSAVGSISKPIYYTGSSFATITDLNLLSEASGHGYVSAKRFVLFSNNGTEIYFEWVPGQNGDPGYVQLNSAFLTSGDQIVGDGTPGGGGGGAGYLYELEDVYHKNAQSQDVNYVARADGSEKQVGDVLQYYDSTKGWVAAPISTGQTYYRDFGITLNNNAFSVAHDVAAYEDEETITFDPDSHSGVMAENPVEWGAAITYGVNLMVNNTTKGLALASSVVDLWTAVNGKQPAGNYLTSVPLATDSVIGGFQTGFTQSGKNYPVQLSSNKAYVNVPWTDTTYSNATTSAAGLMSAADKTKLNGIAEGANNYSLPMASSSVLGGIKIGTGLTIDSSGVVSVTGQTQGTVTRVYVGSTAYNPDSSGYVSLPAYPTVPTNVSAFTNDAGYITSYTNTWRNVYTGGTSRVGTGTDTKAINFAAGSNVTITYEAAGTGSGQSGSANYFNVKIAASMAFSNLTSHPTTIAGYGITDAKIANGVITLGSDTITPLTSHQTLYNLVINNSAGTAQITYKPGTSGTYSLTLTKAMVGLGNVENTALSTWAGTTNITTLGTITSGTWSGTTIGVAKGGTGKTSIAAFAIIYASAANTYAELAPNTTSTRKFLRMTGTGIAGAAPAWDTVTKTDVGLGNVPNWAVTNIDSTTQNFVN